MHPRKVLLVDDEAIVVEVLARELRLVGYEVDTATSGNEALELFGEKKYHVVMTDLVMPDLDGIGVLKAVKKISPETCVIILTGYGDMNSVIAALRLGVDDYQIKPCDTEELLFRMDRWFEKKDLVEQLKQQNQLLKEEIKKRVEAEGELRKSEKRFRLALDASSDGVWDRNLVTDEVYYGENWRKSLGYEEDEAIGDGLSWEALLHPEDRQRVWGLRQEHITGKSPLYEVEYRLKNKNNAWQWFLSRGKVVDWAPDGTPARLIGTHTDITKLKQVEDELKHAYDDMEQRVKERTAELEQTNIALNVLLTKRDQDKVDLEQQILLNVSKLVDPYLIQLGESNPSKTQQILIDILKFNISELTSSFTHKVTHQFMKFTPTEVQIANLIKMGRRTKEIAELMHLSPGTINIHRKNIRKKLEITNKKVNLQSFLSSFT